MTSLMISSDSFTALPDLILLSACDRREFTRAASLVVHPVALVPAAVREENCAFTVLLAVLEHALVGLAFLHDEDTGTVRLVIIKLTTINGFIGINLLALQFFVVLPDAIKGVALRPGLVSESMFN